MNTDAARLVSTPAGIVSHNDGDALTDRLEPARSASPGSHTHDLAEMDPARRERRIRGSGARAASAAADLAFALGLCAGLVWREFRRR